MALPRSSSRRDVIRRFRELGFDGPVTGGRHAFMVKGTLKVRIPNPHQGDIGVSLLSEILRQAGITDTEWLGS
jgi:predicted RNA binding protein YcfA (HicA-like mRNA interferase family)